MNLSETHGRENSSGRITLGIAQKDTLVRETIFFVSKQLPAWRDDPDRPQEQAEDRLNLQLCKFLDSRARNEFPMVRFDHEEYQPKGRRTDLSASPVNPTIIGAKSYTIYDPITVLECKRLPAPSPNREKEYVTGGKGRTSGGIQRFKLGLHGANVDVAVMIGYVQEQAPRYWHSKINSWIMEVARGIIEDTCVWSSDEVLGQIEEDSFTGNASCCSTHTRIMPASKKRILIQHLWVIMNTQLPPKNLD